LAAVAERDGVTTVSASDDSNDDRRANDSAITHRRTITDGSAITHRRTITDGSVITDGSAITHRSIITNCRRWWFGGLPS
jgi:carbonic anhydrase/acetyltransferase-like protein (isoleucine patch superfamily)